MHEKCVHQERWDKFLVQSGRMEGKLDSITKAVNGNLSAMREHIRESDSFRKQVTTNAVWIIIYRWILGFLVGGSVSVWVYMLRKLSNL